MPTKNSIKVKDCTYENSDNFFLEAFKTKDYDFCDYIALKYSRNYYLFYKTYRHLCKIEDISGFEFLLNKTYISKKRKIKYISGIHISELLCLIIIEGIKQNSKTLIDFSLNHKKFKVDEKNNFAIRKAAELGKLNLVKKLIKMKADPSDMKNRAIILAKKNKHYKIFDLLLNNEQVLKKLEEENLELYLELKVGNKIKNF